MNRRWRKCRGLEKMAAMKGSLASQDRQEAEYTRAHLGQFLRTEPFKRGRRYGSLHHCKSSKFSRATSIDFPEEIGVKTRILPAKRTVEHLVSAFDKRKRDASAAGRYPSVSGSIIGVEERAESEIGRYLKGRLI